ncbi:hypothetical protein CVM73_35370 [Bradyrhizobium forestalis]|uniref:Alpha/beta hydrolase n=1 Tax=Bradyrhizobium forestalis TaxID=1419263 RepID=A0A2M8QYD7_9BRAD|nr:hypothetical protein CVM73_35370 [Bradyrhizobium forestalis]
MFLDAFDEGSEAASRRDCAAKWINIGDAHCLFGNLNVERGTFDEAVQACLCALTAFEVAKRLSDEDDSQRREVWAKLEASVERFASLDQKVERVDIALCDEDKLSAYYVPAGASSSRVPAILCISREEETAAILLARLLPLMISRSMAVLVVSYDDVSNHWLGPSEMLLSCCLDYLSARPEIDATRIAIFGEGLSAALATACAVADRRIAAAICDGGLWSWTRLRASIEWMTRTADLPDEGLSSAQRSRLARRLRCPVLVVAGERSLFGVSEAIKLEAECTATSIDLELLLPPTPEGGLENFVACDEGVFKWLERKFEHATASQ